MRLFVAIEIESEIRSRIDGFVARLKPQLEGARWVRPEGMHLTLKFLGNVTDERRSPIELSLGGVRASSFAINVGNVGVFPNPKFPRVLWVGIQAGPELTELAQQIEERMSRLGFPREMRAFAAHITVARLNNRSKTSSLNSVLSAPQPGFGTMTAKEFHLYESKLSPQGSRYSKLAAFRLH